MAYARAALVTKALGNLGIVLQSDAGAARTRAELVTETRACLGLVQQTDTGTPRTRIELVARAARRLGVLPSGQTLSAEDSAIIDANIDPLIADLHVRAVVTIANANAIPAGMFEAVATMLADVSKDAYEGTGAATVQLATDAQLAERKLRNFDSGAIIDEKLPSIMAELNARMIAAVPLAAIPAAWFPALADICAESVKAKFALDPAIAAGLPVRAARAERILKNLNRSSLIDQNLEAILAEVAADELVLVADPTDIPDAWFVDLAAIVADRCKAEFELETDVMMRVAAAAVTATATLRRITRGRPGYNRFVPEWF